MSPRSSFTSDEGAYALQARALGHGSWAYDYKAAAVDPEGKAFPLFNSSRDGNQYYAYIQHPAYPLLLAGVSAIAGSTVGLHLLALLGTLGTAAAAWLLAGAVDARLRRSAFWLAALGPALVNGYLLWAHTLAAAVAGLTLVALVKAMRANSSLRWWIVTSTGLVAGVLLRSEGLLFAGAVAAVAAVVAWRRPIAGGVRRRVPAPIPAWAIRTLRAGTISAVLAGPALMAALLERLWLRNIIGDVYDNLHDRTGAAGTSWLAGRRTGAWHDLFQGSDVPGSGRVLAVLAMVAVVGFGVLALRRWRNDCVPALGIGTAIAIGATALEYAFYPGTPVSGLFAVWPVALLGLVLVRWRREVPVLGAVAGLFALAVIATEYPEGGGIEWGGRFFFPLLAPLAALAIVGLHRRLTTAPPAGRYGATALLALLAVVGAGSGVASARVLRSDQGRAGAAVARHHAAVTITTEPYLPRVAWSTHDTVNWMLIDAPGLHDLLAGVRAKGLGEVDLVMPRPGPGQTATMAGFDTVEEANEPDLARFGLGLYILRS